ncbi:MAG: hypothetical protein QG661_3213 [Actinomycetota bacterium]|nr:hypothetical protein [Actinomycetota bacterium]
MAHMHITHYPTATQPTLPLAGFGFYEPTLTLSAAGWSASLGTNQWYYSTITDGAQSLITVTGMVEITADAAESSNLVIELPIAPGGNWTARWQVSGIGAPEAPTVFSPGTVSATVGGITATATLTANGAGTINHVFTFTYGVP